MEIILLERVEKLGHMGDVVKVKDGYARNFLLPQKKALLATKENKARFEAEKEALQIVNDEKRTLAESAAKEVDGKDFILIRQAGDTGQLFGSVTARDIADKISQSGVAIKRQQIKLDVPIKTLGIHQLQLVLHPEVTVNININVARSDEEASIQSKGGTLKASSEEREDISEVDKTVFDTEELAAKAEAKLLTENMNSETDKLSQENRVIPQDTESKIGKNPDQDLIDEKEE